MRCDSYSLLYHNRSQWRVQDFPDMGSPTSEFGPKRIIYRPDFDQQLHQNERNWTEKGGART